MKRNYINIIMASIMLFTYACKPNLKPYLPTSGEADFSSYVAIGNSLTSGYADGALIYSGQLNSYPVMLSEQFALAGGGTFKVPYLPQSGNGNDGAGGNRRVLGNSSNCLGVVSLGPVLASGASTTLTDVSANGPYNLIGVPGARAVDAVFPGYAGFNPFLSRFCSSVATSTLLSEALRANPTFYSLWLGNNDVLGYATGGGVGAVSPAFPFPGSLTDPAQVQAALYMIMDSLSQRGAKGVIMNIPDVTSIPFFTTIPYNGVTVSQGMADTLNGIYTALGFTDIIWKAGANPFIIVDSSVANPFYKIRQAKYNEYIVLSTPLDSVRCGQWGINPMKPLTDRYVLDENEISIIKNYTEQYNTIISNLASNFNVALADMNTYMKSFQAGVNYNNIKMDAIFVSGGAFSLDGVHPNPRGYALIANEIIRTINNKYGSHLPEKDVTRYDGIIFPTN